VREWEALVSAALLGTTRRELDTSVLPDPVRKLADGSDPEHVLLSAAALLTGYRRAGRLPERDVPALSVAAPDDRPLVGVDARRRLALMLYGDHGNLLPEWLSAVAARGLRVPPERLPALADVARGRPELRAAVAAAAGPRGPWLADLQPDWAFLAEQPVDDPEVWNLGTAGQRVSWLARIRGVDPASARSLLAEVWSSEPAPVRVRFLDVLRTGLSTSDEEFLEAALDDRAREVRRSAAVLLTSLPGSALSARMADRLRPLISVRRRTLAVELPASCDESMVRDGVNPVPPKGVGERAWWLGQLVSAAPLAVWTELAPVDLLVRMAVDGVDPRLLALGWAAAAVREHAADWVLALLDGDIAIGAEQLAAMIAVLPRESWAPVLAQQPLTPALLAALPTPWPPELGTLVLDAVARHRDSRALAHVAEIAAHAAPPECLDHPITHEPPDYDAAPWRRRLVDTLVFRRAMHAELSSPTPAAASPESQS
jgi:hypothetical protein